MPKLYLSVLVLLAGLGAFAQNSITLKGKILDSKTQVPMEAVTVYFSSAKDSTLIDYTITDKSGAFVLTARKTDKPVIFKISFVGYKEIEKRYEKGLSENIDFGIMRLEEGANMLGEVVIKSEAPPIRIKNDTLEFNASSFKVRPDANVETLLKQLPGVEIDAEGKITVNGKEVNQILVNGKPFFDKDGKVALQNLPSDIINKVQITDTKSKKEELSGESASSNNASINLTIDEDKNKGFFGKVTGGYGTDERYEGSIMMNYFKDKRKISILGSVNNINSTGFSMDEIFDSMGGGRNYSVWSNDNGGFGINNMSFGGGNGITKSSIIGLNYGDEFLKDLSTNGSYFFTGAKTENNNRSRQVTLVTGEEGAENNNFTTESQAKTVDDKFAHNFNAEFEYKIDSMTTLSVSPKFVRANSKYSSVSSSTITNDKDGSLAQESSSDIFNESDNDNFSSSLYLNRSFKRTGRNLSLWMQTEYNKEDAANRNISFNNFYGVDGLDEDNRNQVSYDRNHKDYFTGGIEFSEPLKDSIGIKVGLNFSRDQNISDRVTYDFDEATGRYSVLNDTITNYMRSGKRSLNPEAGFSIQRSKLNLSVSLGTVITLFEANSFYFGEKTALSKEYIYPSVSAWGGYRFGKSQSMWMNYSYNVDFASAAQILPVLDISNPQNFFTGNADLNPNKSHYFYLNFRDYDYATKSGYNLYAGGNLYDSQIISSTVYDTVSRRANTTYKNVSGNVNMWFGGNWNKTIKREAHSYRFGIGLNAGYNRNQAFTNGELFDSKSWRLTPRVNFNYDYGELLSIGPKYEITYNQTEYSNFNINSNKNITQRLTLQTTSYWPKHVVFGNDFSYTYNSNIAPGFKKDFYLWNVSLGYNFFGDKLLAKVKVYDMLNQNQNTMRTISSNYISDQQNDVLKRYAMFSLTYKLEKFGGKKKNGQVFFME